ncbi:hypothetical protein [Paenibacillus sp. MMS18-CY102]|uniref:hypothetical protein n=1 Tax=Paenibacillus sp. MMS18-CY102 TaxID=2682849 RepID=UPI0013661A2C|nr:hypothetical protein [Paenibacillus sp. MMS18-CY102]MWC29061.1 hypothetical protein [Paenibacillus sp. MMS18-CY102]
MVEHVRTEKEPGVPEWTSREEDKREHADLPPKLTMKLLYGMIQEVQQHNERIAARLDEFEHYLLEVQAARAQLEASAAKTIAKAKALAALSEAAASADATLAHAQLSAVNDEATNALRQLGPVSDDATPAMAQLGAVSGEANPAMAQLGAVNDETTPAPAQLGAVSGEANPAMVQLGAVNDETTPASAQLGAVSDEANPAMAQLGPASDEAAIALGLVPLGANSADAMPSAVILHGKAGARASQPESLMSLAMEVLGFPNDDHSYDSSEDGLDPGEGANPFDTESFLVIEAAATSEAAPRAFAQDNANAATKSMPFFTPRSQRHPAPKKSFLNLLGFRTRIS